MKVASLCLIASALNLVAAGPGKPEITIGINSDALDSGVLSALEPTVKWQTSETVAGFDVEGGLSMTVTDKDQLPYTLWGKIKKSVGGVDFSARVDTESSTMNKFGLDLQASMAGTKIQVKGKADTDASTVTVDNVQLSQSLDAVGGSLTITPKYTIASKKADVKVKYGLAGTVVTVDANKDKQKVTISQSLGDIGSVTPSITSEGDIQLEYSRPVAGGVLSVAYKPNDSVDVGFVQGPWAATVSAPMDGYSNFNERVQVNVRRAIDVTK